MQISYLHLGIFLPGGPDLTLFHDIRRDLVRVWELLGVGLIDLDKFDCFFRLRLIDGQCLMECFMPCSLTSADYVLGCVGCVRCLLLFQYRSLGLWNDDKVIAISNEWCDPLYRVGEFCVKGEAFKGIESEDIIFECKYESWD